MPRYYFHLLHPGRAPVRDDEGIEFENNAIAKREGMASLSELITDALHADPIPLRVSVQIVREGHGIIEVLTGTVACRLQP
jgi:hypothetical protein